MAMSSRTMLWSGILAGPLYLLVGYAQAFTRKGFDLRHHPLSVLSNGDLGWIQVLNFLVSGALVIDSLHVRRGRFLLADRCLLRVRPPVPP